MFHVKHWEVFMFGILHNVSRETFSPYMLYKRGVKHYFEGV